ncbi:MAG: Co2+/Mg2+ efflux protein ApaG [Thiopseudomonas sp.]
MSNEYPVRVKVSTRYIPDHSAPDEQRFVFAYDIIVRNEGNEPVQLLTRHWIITDGDGKTQEVRGEGVVGEQPVIPPGTEYRYTSGTLLNTEVGSMQGSFGMQTEDGVEFTAPISPFTLAQPGALH